MPSPPHPTPPHPCPCARRARQRRRCPVRWRGRPRLLGSRRRPDGHPRQHLLLQYRHHRGRGGGGGRRTGSNSRQAPGAERPFAGEWRRDCRALSSGVPGPAAPRAITQLGRPGLPPFCSSGAVRQPEAAEAAAAGHTRGDATLAGGRCGIAGTCDSKGPVRHRCGCDWGGDLLTMRHQGVGGSMDGLQLHGGCATSCLPCAAYADQGSTHWLAARSAARCAGVKGAGKSVGASRAVSALPSTYQTSTAGSEQAPANGANTQSAAFAADVTAGSLAVAPTGLPAAGPELAASSGAGPGDGVSRCRSLAKSTAALQRAKGISGGQLVCVLCTVRLESLCSPAPCVSVRPWLTHPAASRRHLDALQGEPAPAAAPPALRPGEWEARMRERLGLGR